MQLIKNNDDTPITIRTYSPIAEDREHFYLKFTDSSNSNSVVLELGNRSDKPKYYSRFLILENSGIPTGRGIMEFYASSQAGLTEPLEADLVSTDSYQLEALGKFEIVQYYPEKEEIVYYQQL